MMALYDEVQVGNLTTVADLINQGAYLNQQSSNGEYPLHAAVKHSNKLLVTLLLEKGGKVNCLNSDGLTPLHYASRMGDLDIFTILLQHGARENVQDRLFWMPLHYACFHGHLNIVEYILEHTPSTINETDDMGHSALHIACKFGHLDIASKLIQAGANFLSRDDAYKMPLSYLPPLKDCREQLAIPSQPELACFTDLSKDLLTLFDNSLYSDMQFIVEALPEADDQGLILDDKTTTYCIPAHRAILHARCPMLLQEAPPFRILFGNDVKIFGITIALFRAILEFVYTGNITFNTTEINLDFVFNLTKKGQECEVPSLSQFSESLIVSNMDTETVVSVLNVASSYKFSPAIEDFCRHYIVKHFDEIMAARPDDLVSIKASDLLHVFEMAEFQVAPSVPVCNAIEKLPELSVTLVQSISGPMTSTFATGSIENAGRQCGYKDMVATGSAGSAAGAATGGDAALLPTSDAGILPLSSYVSTGTPNSAKSNKYKKLKTPSDYPLDPSVPSSLFIEPLGNGANSTGVSYAPVDTKLAHFEPLPQTIPSQTTSPVSHHIPLYNVDHPVSSNMAGTHYPGEVAAPVALFDGKSASHSSRNPPDALVGNLFDAVKRLHKSLMCERDAVQFNTPVDFILLALPEYPEIIRHPMDLGTIQTNLSNKHYWLLPNWVRDVRLVWDNARIFNNPKSVIFMYAERLSSLFEMQYTHLQKQLGLPADYDVYHPKDPLWYIRTYNENLNTYRTKLGLAPVPLDVDSNVAVLPSQPSRHMKSGPGGVKKVPTKFPARSTKGSATKRKNTSTSLHPNTMSTATTSSPHPDSMAVSPKSALDNIPVKNDPIQFNTISSSFDLPVASSSHGHVESLGPLPLKSLISDNTLPQDLSGVHHPMTEAGLHTTISSDETEELSRMIGLLNDDQSAKMVQILDIQPNSDDEYEISMETLSPESILKMQNFLYEEFGPPTKRKKDISSLENNSM